MTLDEVLAMTAEDVPELAGECQRMLRFRQADRTYRAQLAHADREAHVVAAFNRTAPKRSRIAYT